MKISLFGAGFIGGKFNELYKDEVYIESRESINPVNDKVLYFRGTTTNYNIFNNPNLDIDVNLTLFVNTLKNLKPNSEFNHISSWFVHAPQGFYSATKLCQEHLLESYCHTFYHKYRILRLCNIIGGDNKKSSQKNALEFIIDKLKKNDNIQIYEGDNYRNYLHVEDGCRAIKLALDKGKLDETYEIGDIKSYKLIDLIEHCKRKLDSKSVITRIKTPYFHEIVQVKDFHMDTQKIYELGFKPNYNIFETLDLLCK